MHDSVRRMAWVSPTTMFAVVAIAMYLLHGQYGYAPTDDDFILSLSWRVAQGQVPYRDFIYVRPPIPLYLHTLWLVLPEGLQVMGSRFAPYLELTCTAAFPTLWALSIKRFRLGIESTALILLSVVIAVHTFAPTPWHTVDALLFSSAGLTAYLYSIDRDGRSGYLWRGLASVLLALAALCKQPFAVMPVLLVAVAIVEYIATRTEFRKLAAAIVPGVSVLLIMLGLMAWSGALGPFISQLGAASRTGDLWRSGVLSYLVEIYKRPWWILGGCVLAVLSLATPRLRLHRVAIPFTAAAMAAAMVLIVVGYPPISSNGGPVAGHMIFGLMSGWCLGWVAMCRRNVSIPWLVLSFGTLASAWAASISWGYISPILGLAPVGIMLAGTVPRHTSRIAPFATMIVAVVGIAFLTDLNVQRPYADRPRAELGSNIGEIYPRYGAIMTSQENYIKLRELQELSDRFATSQGKPFVVMPDYPLVYFLSGRPSPIAIDWPIAVEHPGLTDVLIRQLNERLPVVLLEQSRCKPDGFAERAPVAQAIATTWRPIHGGLAFCVYEHNS